MCLLEQLAQGTKSGGQTPCDNVPFEKRFKFKSNNGLMMIRNSPDFMELLKTEG